MEYLSLEFEVYPVDVTTSQLNSGQKSWIEQCMACLPRSSHNLPISLPSVVGVAAFNMRAYTIQSTSCRGCGSCLE